MAFSICVVVLAGLSPGGMVQAAVGASVADLERVYQYTDDFSEETALNDSTLHSLFWIKGAFPPSQPSLVYWAIEEDEQAILFRDHQGQPARLGYAVPVRPQELIRAESLVVEVGLDLQLLSSTDPAIVVAGYLLYMVSADGTTWSIPQALSPGRCLLHLGSLKNNRYLVFVGTQAVVDNLSIEIYRSKADIQVPQDFPTLQQAIDSAQNGDRIVVADGTYTGPGNRDIRFKGKEICLVSANGPANCIIDCQLQGRAFVFDSAESSNTLVDGFTLLYGQSPAGEGGGGIYCQKSSPTIANCSIRYCRSIGGTGPGQGGGIYCKDGSPLIQYCQITLNESRFSSTKPGGSGGGMYVTGDCRAVMEHCTFMSNEATADSSTDDKGGGLYIEAGPGKDAPGPTIRNCLFYANRAGDSGGAIACLDVRPTILNCTIANNRAGQSGGGLSIDLTGPLFGTATLKNSIIWDNLPNEIAMTGEEGGTLAAQYCDIKGGGVMGTGNIDRDPFFGNAEGGDYHLFSLMGRWDPLMAGAWVYDKAVSPCIDAGDPSDSVGAEPVPNGNRINMGAYGGTIQASKGSGPLVFHVAANGSDQNAGIDTSAPLATIQKAVEMARDGDSVLVWPGTYYEGVDFLGKAILVQSAADAAIVVASQDYAFSFNRQEGPSSVLRNLVIRNCTKAGVLCHTGAPTLSNLTIVQCGLGIVSYENAQPRITNCILWDNAEADLRNCQARYSCIQRSDQAMGEGNIQTAPLFKEPQNADFHLRSRYGRYWPPYDVWVVDDKTSPCIDAGDPNGYPMEEPNENGDRLNMGAYGGTGYASMSPPALESDLNHDGIVDFRDMAILADHWLQSEL